MEFHCYAEREGVTVAYLEVSKGAIASFPLKDDL